MTTFPKALHDRVAATIKGHVTKLALHAQQIVTLQSTTAALVPGSWEDIALLAGWSNIGGYIPAQVRILQNGMSQVIGHIQGGTTANNTIIGKLDPGFYNAVHAHTFSLNAISGASSVSHSGALGDTSGSITGASTQIPTADHSLSVSIPNYNIPTSNHTVNSTPFTLGPSGIQFNNNPSGGGSTAIGPSSGVQFSNSINGTATNLHSGSTSTNVNMNTPTLTLDTSGNLKITNVDPNVNQLSFAELIPLITI